jgi:hypothetical protein
VRHIQSRLQDPRSIQALDCAERFVVGEATSEELHQAFALAAEVVNEVVDAGGGPEYHDVLAAMWAAADPAYAPSSYLVAHAAYFAAQSRSNQGLDLHELEYQERLIETF